MIQKIIKLFSILIIIIGCVFLANSLILAWSSPGSTPPAGNVSPPINTGSSNQTKNAGLTLDGSTYGLWADGTSYGVFGQDSDGGAYGYLGVSNYYGGYFVGKYGAYVYDSDHGTNAYLAHQGYGIHSNGIIRGSYFMDHNSTSYVVDPAGTSYLNDIRVNIMYDRQNTGYYIDPNSTSRLNYGIYDNLYSYGWMQAAIFYDRNNTSYYLNPASTSYLNDIRVNIMYDRQNTGYYVDPASTSKLNTLYSNVYYYSDRRLKENIKTIDDSLGKILKLEGVSFEWKDKKMGEGVNIGFIAQDVEEIFPEVVSTDEETGFKFLQYGNLAAPLIEAIKEQQKIIETLEERIEELENKIK